jgi:hypothetical protein
MSGCWLIVTSIKVNTSFAAEDWRGRLKHIEAFRIIMSSWPQFPEELKTPVPTHDEASFEVTEVKVITFYAQTHFDYIGRMPVMPRRLPGALPLWVSNNFGRRS